jgi:hypothetical protein
MSTIQKSAFLVSKLLIIVSIKLINIFTINIWIILIGSKSAFDSRSVICCFLARKVAYFFIFHSALLFEEVTFEFVLAGFLEKGVFWVKKGLFLEELFGGVEEGLFFWLADWLLKGDAEGFEFEVGAEFAIVVL